MAVAKERDKKGKEETGRKRRKDGGGGIYRPMHALCRLYREA